MEWIGQNSMLILGVIIGLMIGQFVWINQNSEMTGDVQKIIQILVRQCSRWHIASRNDLNVMIAVLHANYAAGYLWALKDIATDSQIKAATGIDVQRFTQEVVNTQDWATKRMAKLCPGYAPTDSYMAKIAGAF